MSNTCLHSISKQRRKKYGANAPQLHPIRCSIDFCVMLCNEQGKIKKIRRKRATVAPYLPACSLISPSTVLPQIRGYPRRGGSGVELGGDACIAPGTRSP